MVNALRQDLQHLAVSSEATRSGIRAERTASELVLFLVQER